MAEDTPTFHESYPDYSARIRRLSDEKTTQDPRIRTLEQHDAFLRTLGTGDADNLGRTEYMLAHGLEYRTDGDGTRHLVWAPSSVYREAAIDAKQRRAAPMNYAANQRTLLDTKTRDAAMKAITEESMGGIAQMARAPGKMFSRETICAIVRGQMAITHDSHMRDLLTIFENLE